MLARAITATLLHYMDDFLFVTAQSEGHHTLQSAVGVHVSEDNTESPGSDITFLGVVIDTGTFQLRLPPAKLARLQELVRLWSVIDQKGSRVAPWSFVTCRNGCHAGKDISSFFTACLHFYTPVMLQIISWGSTVDSLVLGYTPVLVTIPGYYCSSNIPY